VRRILIKSGVCRETDNRLKVHVWVRLFILFLIVGGITWLLYETGLIAFFLDRDKMLAFIESLGPWGLVGFIALQVVQVVAAPIPGEVTGFIGGYLYGPFMGVIWSTIGLTLGSYIAFALSKYFGRPFVERFVDKDTINRFDYLLHHKGVFLIFLLFFIPGTPKDFLCYILGLGHLTTMQFLVISSVGRLFGTILLTVGGDLVRKDEYAEFFVLVGITIIVVLLTMIFKGKIEYLLKRLHLSACEDSPAANKPSLAGDKKEKSHDGPGHLPLDK
jgi:uncharacterized membrane protein YdjX (TVP38/TMEM64 family)